MNNIFDTHAHYSSRQFDADRAELLTALLNGEPLFEWNYLAALVLVCIGIFLVNRAPQTQETKA